MSLYRELKRRNVFRVASVTHKTGKQLDCVIISNPEAYDNHLKGRRPVNPEACEACLKGWYHLNKWSGEGFAKGLEYFQQAVEMGPNYALAHADVDLNPN